MYKKLKTWGNGAGAGGSFLTDDRVRRNAGGCLQIHLRKTDASVRGWEKGTPFLIPSLIVSDFAVICNRKSNINIGKYKDNFVRNRKKKGTERREAEKV